MIFFLTYHKVLANPGPGEPDFYSLSRGQLARQIEVLQSHGLAGLKMEDLIAGKLPAQNTYILSFDDATADHYESVFPLLQEHKCQGVFFIPTARLNQPGFLTDAQVRELAAAGHHIGFHSHEHQRLDLSSADEVRGQLARSQEILGALLGAKPVAFAPPGGFINARIRAAAVELGVRVIRTMRWGGNPKPDLLALETIPINRHVTEGNFMHHLESPNARLLYTGKETLKRLIPLRAYEWLRRQVFKFSKPD